MDWSVIPRTTLAVGLVAVALLPSCLGIPPDPIEVTEADNGTDRAIQVGQSIAVVLSSDATPASEWYLISSGAPMLELATWTVEEGSLTPGATTLEEFTFVATEPGTTVISFNYHNVLQPNTPPTKTFFIQVSIEG
jgi:predicted secreted protein